MTPALYAGFGGVLPGMMTRIMAAGCYKIPRISFEVAVAITNTTSMGAYRGVGRPEAAALVERIMDMAADELGIDPAELRRRNFIGPTEFPYGTVVGAEYDSGDYAAALAEALRVADYDGLLAEQAGRRRRGDRWQLGIGLSSYVEITGGGGSEFASVEVHGDGTATVKAGTSAHGQGHATAYSMIVADALGIPMSNIRFVQSDTASVLRGGGTGGSRSLQMGGAAVSESAHLLVDRARSLAAEMFETAPEDIVVTSDGRFMVAGVPSRALGWPEISRASEDKGEPLLVEHDSHQEASTFPFGAHVSVVEVDIETGRGLSRSVISQLTTAAASSIPCSWTAKCTAAWHLVSPKPFGRSTSTTKTGTLSPPRSPTTRCRACQSSRRSSSRTLRRPQRSTRSGPKASASQPPSAPRRRCRTLWSMLSATWAFATSTCRARLSASAGDPRRRVRRTRTVLERAARGVPHVGHGRPGRGGGGSSQSLKPESS